MKNIIYVVAGGINYQGDRLETVALFTDKAAAKTYGQRLVTHGNYDYYIIQDRTVDLTLTSTN